jgi:acyl carrier protein
MLIEKKIQKIVFSIKKSIDLKSDISTQLDSLQFLNLIIKLEKNFNIKFPQKKINKINFKNIKSIKKIIN